jgi:sec-independent protein translocase protein TatA
MPFQVGPLELVVVLAIALIVLGPKKLPEVGRSLGRGMREFKNSLSGEHEEAEEEPAAPSKEKALPKSVDSR